MNNEFDEYDDEIGETEEREELEAIERRPAPRASEVRLCKGLFNKQLQKNNIDIEIDMVVIDFSMLKSIHYFTQEDVGKYSEDVFGGRFERGYDGLNEFPVVTNSKIATSSSINTLISFPNTRIVEATFTRITRLMGARLFIINAVDLKVEVPIMNSDLSDAILAEPSNGSVNLDLL